ncbi:MAG TPA: YcxB family protein [Chitinophagaceae bacterium]|nr:YcxB family protein [Chitinophagaceae bacterium]
MQDQDTGGLSYIVTQNLSFADVCSASLYIFFNSAFIKAIFIIGTVGGILDFLMPTEQDKRPVVIMTLLLPLLVSVLIAVLSLLPAAGLFLVAPYRFRGIVYKFSSWGIEKADSGLGDKRPWKKTRKIVETKHFFLVYFTRFDAHVIVKKAFRSEGEIDQFRLFLEKVTKS